MGRIHTAMLLSSATLALVAASGAQAQEGAPATQAAPGDTGAVAEPVEDIVVVGTAGGGIRRQDAAFAVTALSNDTIERLAPASTADLLRAIPGVSAESSGGQNGANIFVRGYPSGGDAEFVTFQLNGVPIFPPPTLSFLENSQLVRIDETVARVEAVRGGTGALFASGQPGLTVNLVQREGGRDLAGAVKLSATDFGELRGDAWVSGPLGPNTGFMVGGFYARSDGIRDPQFRAEKGGQITANIRHEFERGSLLVYGRYLDDYGQWLLPIPVVQDGRKISDFPGFDAQKGALAGREIRRTVRNDGSAVDLADGRGATLGNVGLTFDYELADGLKIRERASYLNGDADTVGLVPDGPPSTAAAYVARYGTGAQVGSLTFVNGGGAVSAQQQVIQAGVWEVRKDVKSFVNDLALEFKAGSNTLTVGGYFADYSSRDRWSLGNGLLLTAEENGRPLNLVLADGRVATRDGFVQGSFFNVNARYSGNDYAIYAVDEFQLTPELRLDAGLRWQKHDVDGRLENNTFTVDTDNNPATLYNNGTAVLNGTFSDIRYRGDKWSWTAGANYDFSRQVGAFLRYSRGNSFPFFDNLRDNLRLAPRVDSYEGGLKVSTDLLNIYATLFHNRFKGLATTQIINGAPIAQVGGARTTGLELEGALRPAPGLQIAFAGTYLDAKYRDFFTGGGGIDNTGNRVQRQPKWAWRVTPSYDYDFGGGTASVFGTVAYVGDRFSDPENNQLLPRFTKIDAGVAVELDGGWRVQVTGDNLTNKIGLTEGNPRLIGSQGSGAILARPILGRSFRFSAGYRF